MTLFELIERSAARLTEAGVSFGHGTTSAFDEAVWLVLWKLGLPLHELDSVARRELSSAEQHTVQALIDERIATRRPAAYLTREAWLQGVPFYVDERVIVPRSLIAEPLADGTLDAWLLSSHSPAWEPSRAQPAAVTKNVLDLCTGNGSLAILAALAWPDVRVDATDISLGALDVARINVDKHELQSRITLIASNGLAAVNGRYDLILCNPPYVNSASMQTLPLEYQAEPALALAGGTDGMDFIRGLLRDAPRHMTEQAALVLEIGHERAHFETAFPELEVLWLSTSAGDDQVLLLTQDALAKKP